MNFPAQEPDLGVLVDPNPVFEKDWDLVFTKRRTFLNCGARSSIPDPFNLKQELILWGS